MEDQEVAKKAARSIAGNLKGRRGMWPDDLDDEIEAEILEYIAKVIDRPAYALRKVIAKVVAHQLRAALERSKRLEDALIRLRDCDWVITLPDRMDAVREIAKSALLAAPQPTELDSKPSTKKEG